MALTMRSLRAMAPHKSSPRLVPEDELGLAAFAVLEIVRVFVERLVGLGGGVKNFGLIAIKKTGDNQVAVFQKRGDLFSGSLQDIENSMQLVDWRPNSSKVKEESQFKRSVTSKLVELSIFPSREYEEPLLDGWLAGP